ncbi:Aste57867_24276 [Aphanomyces stellatus]|uniref:Aste57867_24276 protein n=1 Tax=Aphanomyces stellatus TaxID=120398 RepID=A0A485LUC9_9STRA|nr:hypothetical protein As57867_024201 [Aphanomyces stellatus]VFU00916.1 Aste57867_24276 [Aphanomyces stellatus]
MGNKQGKLKRRSGEDRPSITGSTNVKRPIWPKAPSPSHNSQTNGGSVGLPPAPISPPKSATLDHPDFIPKDLPLETYQLVEHTHFSAKEIDSIRENTFSLLGLTLSPSSYQEISITKDDFMKFLGVSSHSLFPNRLFAIFDVSNREYLSFPDLVRGLSILSQKATRDEKLRMAFQLLDPAGSGYITREATTSVLKSCLDESKEIALTDDQIDKLVASTFHEADLDRNGVIDFAEYQALDSRHPGLLEFLTVDSTGILNSLDKQKTSLAQ